MATVTQFANASTQMSAETESSWRAALELEVASAGTPRDMVTLERLINCYGELSCDDHLLQVLTHFLRFNDSKPQVVALLLEWLIRQRALQHLPPVLTLATAVVERPAPLRRALATAYAELGQIPQAAEEWCVLLREPPVDRVTWQRLAAFLNRHGDVGGIGGLLAKLGETFQRPDLDPHALFCLLRVQLDQPTADVLPLLERIPSTAFEDPEFQLSLAIMAFRVPAYDRARRAVDHALALKPGWKTAVQVRRTIDSFDGQPVRDMPLLSIAQEILAAAESQARRVRPDEHAWGLLRVKSPDHVEARKLTIASVDDRLLEVPLNADISATFSVLPDSYKAKGRARNRCDALELLPFVDWCVPHVMVQRTNGKSVSHIFTGVPGHREWYWEEVASGSRVIDEGAPDAARNLANWHLALDELRARAAEEDL